MPVRIAKSVIRIPSHERDAAGFYGMPTVARPGQKIELTSEQEAQLEEAGALVSKEEQAASDAEPQPERPTRKKQLQARARELGVDTRGSIAELEARIAETESGQVADDGNDGDDGSGS